jgi:hypothetical protein
MLQLEPISIYYDNQIIRIEIQPNNTIHTLKYKIQDILHISQKNQVLIVDETILNDFNTLLESNILEEIDNQISLRGGGTINIRSLVCNKHITLNINQC